jgi:hypothetical protein
MTARDDIIALGKRIGQSVPAAEEFAPVSPPPFEDDRPGRKGTCDLRRPPGLESQVGHRSLVEWTEAQRSPRLHAQIDILERRLFRTRDMQLDRAAPTDLVGAAMTHVTPSAKSKLPELNPGGR